MGIIIALAVAAAAVFFKFKYRPEGSNTARIFSVCIAAAVVMVLSVGSTSAVGMLYYLAEIAVCSLIVLFYRHEARREAVARAARKQAVAARASEERIIMQTNRKPLTCFAAFTESVGEAA